MTGMNLLRRAGSLPRGPIVVVVLAAGLAFGFGAYVGSQPTASADAVAVQQEMDPEAMMEMYAQMGAPDEHHEGLHVFVGSWKTQTKALSAGMEAFNSTGSATFEPAMDGRFIKQNFNGNMMGSPFKGTGVTGYNKAAKRYEGVWYDDMSTAMYFVTGKKTDDGWIYEGEETDPMSGQKFSYRHVVKMHGDDKFEFVMQYPPQVAAGMGVQGEEGQDWVDTFQIVYTRAAEGHGGNRNEHPSGR